MPRVLTACISILVAGILVCASSASASPVQTYRTSGQSPVLCTSPILQDAFVPGYDSGMCSEDESLRSLSGGIESELTQAAVEQWTGIVYERWAESAMGSGVSGPSSIGARMGSMGSAVGGVMFMSMTNPGAYSVDRSTGVRAKPYLGTQVVEARVKHVECNRNDVITYRVKFTQSDNLRRVRIENISIAVDNSAGANTVYIDGVDIRGIQDAGEEIPRESLDDNNLMTHEGNELASYYPGNISRHPVGSARTSYDLPYTEHWGTNNNQRPEFTIDDPSKTPAIWLKINSSAVAFDRCFEAKYDQSKQTTNSATDRISISFLPPDQAVEEVVEDDPLLEMVNNSSEVSQGYYSGENGAASMHDFMGCMSSGLNGVSGWGSLFTLAFSAGDDAFVPPNYEEFIHAPDAYTSWTSEGQYNYEVKQAGTIKEKWYKTSFGSAEFTPSLDTAVSLRFSQSDDSYDGALRRIAVSNQIYDIFESCTQNFDQWTDSQKVLLSQLTMFSKSLMEEFQTSYKVENNKFFDMFSSQDPVAASVALSAMNMEEFTAVVSKCGLRVEWQELYYQTNSLGGIVQTRAGAPVTDVPNLICREQYKELVRQEIIYYRSQPEISPTEFRGWLNPVPCLEDTGFRSFKECERPEYVALTPSKISDDVLAQMRLQCSRSAHSNPDDPGMFWTYIPASGPYGAWLDSANANSRECRLYWRAKILRTHGFMLWTEAEVRARLQQCHLSKWDGRDEPCSGLIGNTPYVEALEGRLRELGAREFQYLDDPDDRPVPPPTNPRPDGQQGIVSPQPLCEGGHCAG